VAWVCTIKNKFPRLYSISQCKDNLVRKCGIKSTMSGSGTLVGEGKDIYGNKN